MDAQQVADALRAAHAGKSTYQAAQEWGIGQQMLAAWQDGVNYPTKPEHVAIASRVTGIPIPELELIGRRRKLHNQIDRAQKELEELDRQLAARQDGQG